MSPTFDAFLRSWPFDPWLLLGLLLPAGVYLRGWVLLHRRDPKRWHTGRLVAFQGGLASVFLALGSPIEPFAGLLLQVHMIQHLLLMMSAPALVWLGEPMAPLLRGLPQPIRAVWAAPLLRWAFLRRLLAWLTHPMRALPIFTAVTWLWHVPAAYDLALRSSGWHYLQHACFFAAGLLFWYPVVRPFPARPSWSRWYLLPYLILADVQNTVLSALLTFSDRVLYPWYAALGGLVGVSPLDDQSAAGVIMWVPGSLAFLLPLFAIGVRLLSSAEDRRAAGINLPSPRWGEGLGVRGAGSGEGKSPSPPTPLPSGREGRRKGAARGRISLPLVTPSREGNPAAPARFDLLRLPLLGRFLRWRHVRIALQTPLAVLAGMLIVDGLMGPAASPLNLAGVLPWIHWRGLVILGLLAAGNLFCLACPFQLPRTLARRWLPGRWTWPRRLRSKWLAVLLLLVFLWAYEALALWDSPWWTAWIAVGYFVTAFLVDSVFRGSAFCKYLCPIGQFNFVQSLVSPLEVKVRDPEVCASCKTRDCIRGRDGVPGCELHLYQPRKAGNMDCTFCLDCVHACPHDNIGLLAGPPAGDLWTDPHRSGVGQMGKRPDLAALVLVLVFGAFANAAGMVGPVAEWQDRVQSLLGQRSTFLGVSLFYLVALVVLPATTVGAAALVSRCWAQSTAGVLEAATRYSYALVPMGFAMWLAHYSFHFLTSWETIVPVMQRVAGDLGWTAAGEPEWSRACCRPVSEWLPHLEILFLDLGLLLSLYTGYRISLTQCSQLSRAFKALAPWAVLIVVLFATGVWIVLQPMQMRGAL